MFDPWGVWGPPRRLARRKKIRAGRAEIKRKLKTALTAMIDVKIVLKEQGFTTEARNVQNWCLLNHPNLFKPIN
jgi:hypothetical protein